MTEATPSERTEQMPPAPKARPPHESTRARLRAVLKVLGNPFAFGFTLTLGALAALLLGLALSNLTTVIIYIVLALFVTLGLDPAVRALQRRGLSRPWAIAIAFSAFAAVIVGVLWLIVPTVIGQVLDFVQDLPALVEGFTRTELYARLEGMYGEHLNTLTGRLEDVLTDPGSLALIGGGALRVGFGIASITSGLVIVVVLSLYFLASLEPMKRAGYRLAPARSRSALSSLAEEITQSIGGYLLGMVVLALCNAVIVFLLHLALGLPFPALMAATAFFITLIPLVGSVLFWVIGSILALLSSPASALVFAVVYLVYMQIEAYALTPRVMSKVISIPGALVVIGALVGGTLLGLLGALIAIPVTASLLLIIKRVMIPRQDAKL